MRKNLGARKKAGQSSKPVRAKRASRKNKYGRRFSFQLRKQAVEMYLDGKLKQDLICEEIGVSKSTLSKWIKSYEEEGDAGLRDKPRSGGPRKVPERVRQEIIAEKKKDSKLGVKRIAQILMRRFIPVSKETVRQTLHEEKLIDPPKKKRKKNDAKPRFFERATPNQMWQTDIMTFRLGGKNAYMIGYIDDYSRYLVGLEIFRSQTADNVIELFRRAAGEYGIPKELLSDNGRQYTNWRGTTRFEKELKKERIKHIKSQPHHPMTLGKIERFWQTVLSEYIQRAQFDSFEQARERIALWVKYYNFRRPHQGIGGLCPADRFFEVAGELRKVIEKGVQDNALELALRGEVKRPFYMVGRLDNQSVVMQAEKGKLVMRVNNEEREIDRLITPSEELVYDLNNLTGDKNEPKTKQENNSEKEEEKPSNLYGGRESNSSVEFMEREKDNCGTGQGNGSELQHLAELAESSAGSYVGEVRAASIKGGQSSETTPEISQTFSEEETEESSKLSTKQTEDSVGESLELKALLQQVLVAVNQTQEMPIKDLMDERGREASHYQSGSDHESPDGRTNSDRSSSPAGSVTQDLLRMARAMVAGDSPISKQQASRATEEGNRSRTKESAEGDQKVEGREVTFENASGNQGDLRGPVRRRPPLNPGKQEE